MPKGPAIFHEEIVAYICSGKTTLDAMAHFRFANENIANLRVHAAFKKLGIPRPRYSANRKCEFCGAEFSARDRKQRTCGLEKCQEALIKQWQTDNPDSRKSALTKYRRTEKGRQNNLRMHEKRRDTGLNGSMVERWNFSAFEATKRLRKLKSLEERNPWEYRVTHIQKLTGMTRVHNPRPQRAFPPSSKPPEKWSLALRAVQTTLLQRSSASRFHAWEDAVVRIGQAIRSGTKVRSWKIENEIR